MKIIKKMGMLIVTALFLTSQASAHHSVQGIYQEESIEITGTVIEWVFVNPHPFLTVEVVDESGDTHEWDVSFGGPAVVAMTRRGFSKDTFKPGDVITVTGRPTINESLYGVLGTLGNVPVDQDGNPVVTPAGGRP